MIKAINRINGGCGRIHTDCFIPELMGGRSGWACVTPALAYGQETPRLDCHTSY